jgi:drug/metabolite transporter (DMT)-like permease
MMATLLLFTIQDAMAKHLTQFYPVAEVVWVRFAISLTLMVIVLRGRTFRLLRPARLPLQILRGLLLVGSSYLFIQGTTQMPLADAMTIGFVGPLLLAALSVPFLGEHVSLRRWVAIGVAFLGVVIVLRPTGGGVGWAGLFPLGSAVCFAFVQVITRLLHRTDGPLTMLLYSTIVGAVATAFLAPVGWITPDLTGWGWFLVLGATAALSHWLMIEAFQRAPASTLAPFTYTQIVWGSLVGWVVFNDTPEASTFLGGAVIIACGLFVLFDERRSQAPAQLSTGSER